MLPWIHEFMQAINIVPGVFSIDDIVAYLIVLLIYLTSCLHLQLKKTIILVQVVTLVVFIASILACVSSEEVVLPTESEYTPSDHAQTTIEDSVSNTTIGIILASK